MRPVAKPRRAAGAGAIIVALLLCLFGPTADPARAATNRPDQLSSGSAATARTTVQVSTGGGLGAEVGAKTSGGKLQLVLSDVSPTALTAQDDLVVSGVARNTSGSAMKNVSIELRFSYTALTGRDAVANWVEDGDESITSAVLATAKAKNIAARSVVMFSMTVPAGQIGLSSWSSSFGPRPFTLLATDSKGNELDSLRSTVVWAPDDSPTPVGLSLLTALTSTEPSTTDGLATQDAAAQLMPGSRLSRILSATEDTPIGWAVDPALLASAKALEDGGITEDASDDGVDDEAQASADATASASVQPGSAQSGQGPPVQPTISGDEITDEDASAAATDWLEQLSAGYGDRTTLSLAYSDLDLNSLLKGGKSPALLRQSIKLGESVEKTTLGKVLSTRIAWPADGVLSNQAVDGLVATGHRSVILSADQQQPDPELGYTPSGKSTVHGRSGNLTGLLYDDDLSDLFTEAGEDHSALSTQTMLAELAAISAESGSGEQTRQLLAVTTRDWDPQPEEVEKLVEALREASWVKLSTLKKLGSADSVSRQDHQYGQKAAAAELPKGNLSNAEAMDRDLDNLAPALVSNPEVVQRLQMRIASILSYSWRSDPDGQADARRSVMDEVDSLTGGIQLLIGSESKTFTARSAPIQVTVDNQTDYEVLVSVGFSTGSGQLKIEDQPAAVTIPAQHRQSFRVEAQAIATGDVSVRTTLLTGEGTDQRILGDPQTFEVKVRPNWESWGVVGMAVLLAVLLALGLLRSFRRNRRRPKVPVSAVPDVDDEATQAARQAARAAERERAATTNPIPRIEPGRTDPHGGDRPGTVTDGASISRTGGATNGSPQGSSTGDDIRRPSDSGSASANPGGPRGMHEQKSSSVPTMTAKGAERRGPTTPEEHR